MRTFSIQMTSNLSGVSTDCIRAWERRYQAINPERENGRRVFNETHVSRLVMLKELSALGNPISAVARMSDEELRSLCADLGIRTTARPDAQTGQRNPRETLDLLLLTLRGKRFDIFYHELKKAFIEYPHAELALNVLSPVADELIALHASGSISAEDFSATTNLLKGLVHKKLSEQVLGDAILIPAGHTTSLLKTTLAALIFLENGIEVTFAPDSASGAAMVRASGAKHVFIESLQDVPVLRSGVGQWDGKILTGDIPLSVLAQRLKGH